MRRHNNVMWDVFKPERRFYLEQMSDGSWSWHGLEYADLDVDYVELP